MIIFCSSQKLGDLLSVPQLRSCRAGSFGIQGFFCDNRKTKLLSPGQEAASGIFVSQQAVGLVICSEEHLDKCLGWVDFTLSCENNDLLVGVARAD